ncbi:SAM-dependent methyltransferase, partial [Francisella tularensis]|uniref:SAM-dependent methyltransferase n=1 Tax=Francisella tularensis TaxID=263 RepID=UPI002381ACCB
QLATISSQLGNACSVIESGAGNGKFAAYCVDELESLAILPKRYIIVELSNDLILRQQQYMKENLSHLYDRFIWLDKLPAEKIK